MITTSAQQSHGRHLLRILRGTAISAVCAFGLAQAGHAKAPDFPNQPITVYAPSAAGSASDVEARVLARSMTRILGQPVTVIDMPGGSGSVAEAQLQSRRADGYTLLFEPSSLLTYTVGKKMVPYAITDFVGVAGVGGDAVCLAVRTDRLPIFLAAELHRLCAQPPQHGHGWRLWHRRRVRRHLSGSGRARQDRGPLYSL